MADVGGPAAKAVGSVAEAGEVLEAGEVVQAEVVAEEAGLDLDACAGFEKGSGMGEASSCGFSVEPADGGHGVAGIAAELGDAAIEFSGEGDAVAIERDDGAAAGDSFGEAEGGLGGGEGVGS